VRATQLQLRKQMLAQILRSWPALNFDHLDQTWPAWLEAMQQTLIGYHQQLAAQSSLLYRGTRQLEVGDPGPTLLAAPPTEDWTRKALGYAAPGVWEQRMRAGDDRQQAEKTALVSTLGTSTRIALDGARQTVLDAAETDTNKVRFFRVTDGDPCYFCALLASRGAVYRSAFNAGDGNTYHNDCGCTVGVTFKSGHKVDPVSQQAAEIYDTVSHLSGKERINAFRRAWDARTRVAPAQAA
jgi:hypothetical protein